MHVDKIMEGYTSTQIIRTIRVPNSGPGSLGTDSRNPSSRHIHTQVRLIIEIVLERHHEVNHPPLFYHYFPPEVQQRLSLNRLTDDP